MKISVAIDDSILLQAKARAVERGVSLSAIIEEALRARLAMHPDPSPKALRLVPKPPITRPKPRARAKTRPAKDGDAMTPFFDDHEVEHLLSGA